MFMRLLKLASTLLMLAILFTLPACSGSASFSDHEAVQVILDYWEAMNDFDAEKALSYLEPAYREQERQEVEDDITQMAPLKWLNFRLTITEASEPVYIEDNKVEVQATLDTPIGPNYMLYHLVLLDSKWKITKEGMDPTKTPPRAPNELSATAVSSTQVDLRWNDRSSREDGYHIQRATHTNFKQDLVIFTVGPSVTTYSDTSVSPATTYFYRVTAFGQAGDSAPASTVKVTTP